VSSSWGINTLPTNPRFLWRGRKRGRRTRGSWGGEWSADSVTPAQLIRHMNARSNETGIHVLYSSPSCYLQALEQGLSRDAITISHCSIRKVCWPGIQASGLFHSELWGTFPWTISPIRVWVISPMHICTVLKHWKDLLHRVLTHVRLITTCCNHSAVTLPIWKCDINIYIYMCVIYIHTVYTYTYIYANR
jgi:hypothetical protein